MRDHIVLDVFGSQVSLECGSYGHDGPPLRLTSLASLALTAPREEIGREICRIAVSFRRAGVFLWRIRVWVRPLPIKKPRGRARHRHNTPPAKRKPAPPRSPTTPPHQHPT